MPPAPESSYGPCGDHSGGEGPDETPHEHADHEAGEKTAHPFSLSPSPTRELVTVWKPVR